MFLLATALWSLIPGYVLLSDPTRSFDSHQRMGTAVQRALQYRVDNFKRLPNALVSGCNPSASTCAPRITRCSNLCATVLVLLHRSRGLARGSSFLRHRPLLIARESGHHLQSHFSRTFQADPKAHPSFVAHRNIFLGCSRRLK